MYSHCQHLCNHTFLKLQEQEVTLREQSEIIRSMKHRLKRTWATDPHIAMSPRTKKLLDRYQKDRNTLTEVLTPQLDGSNTCYLDGWFDRVDKDCIACG